ncbi:unnamed protein product [Chrysodeixis includens]|uniref:Uncharacterized protein n=1 Tax=Chrysodeixis includens TaxID=689277 RepID=A0A9P0BLJ8_CHRIL|nr:unnamed protein product [Chrysodeixis includens]
MSYNLLWIFLLILQTFTTSFPLPNGYDMGISDTGQGPMDNSPRLPKYKKPDSSDEKVISVRITSSVAVGRGRGKPTYRHSGHMSDYDLMNFPSKPPPIESSTTTTILKNDENIPSVVTDVPPNLIGANIEYIKQLNAKKETKEHSADVLHSSQLMENDHFDNEDEHFQTDASTKIDEYEHDVPLARKVASTADANRFQEQKASRTYQNAALNRPSEIYTPNYHSNATSDSFNNDAMNADGHMMASNFTLPILAKHLDKKESRDIDRLTSIATFDTNSNNYQTDDSVAESSIKSVEFAKYNENIDDSPPTATMPSDHPLTNPSQGLRNRPTNGGRNNARLTTVSFNIVHDSPKATNDNEPSNSYITSSQVIPNQPGFYNPPKIYSQPAQIYSEPAKFYSEPAKIYSEPSKIYSEPAKVYSEPAKIYSEPSKFYSEPASLHLNHNVPPPSMPPNYSSWPRQSQRPISSTVVNTTPITTATNGIQMGTTQREHQPEKNYEIDEKVSVLTDGRSHGVQAQETSTEKCKQDNCKVGYVVEGRQFKKYRVEERTSDGFIVGEYGVVRNEDGALRGVRYTADSDASPRLIHDALMKFLQLK